MYISKEVIKLFKKHSFFNLQKVYHRYQKKQAIDFQG